MKIGLTAIPKYTDALAEATALFSAFPDVELYCMAGNKVGGISSLFSEEFYKTCDLVIVFGGDGSLIHTASEASEDGVPVLGVRRGHLGYLTEISDLTCETIQKLLEGDYRVEERTMLSFAGSNRAGRVLNDVVVTVDSHLTVAEIEAVCHGESLGIYRCDGLIVATPTGSTAYSLSAGGSVVDPKLDCICFTPICSHSLAGRPLIFSSDSSIELINRGRYTDPLTCYADGNAFCELKPGESILIRKSKNKARLVRFGNAAFYQTVRQKLT